MGAVGLLFACCLCSIPVAIFGPDATPTPEMVAEDEMPTLAPTTEALPTNTPIPTATAEPTDTAEPTATATPEEAQEEGQLATVVEVIDGDTIDVELDGEVQRVR